MAYLMVFLPLFLVLAFLTLRRTYLQKEFCYYVLQIPIFAAVLILNILIASGVQIPSISSVLMKFLSNFVK
ncbi:hypothetical protein CAFE_28780 [Caprobacter fermentans]|uniref:Uncharacterized protein n=1 Tax=Caproicibacter fermentans TaxID=2576756 RepID=A0A6N8I208_9FIRM|nr:hypothetical protein [Caproicibacter fermentans]MVB12146.1 hypothetical protein [Caproicibacter fermentans]